MEFSKEIGSILFDGYWKGGAAGNPKARLGKAEPKPFDEAIEKFPYLLGKIKSSVVMTDYDDLDAFQCRLNIAIKEKQHCIAIKSPNKGGHIYWFNQNHTISVSNSGNKTALTLAPVDYKCGIKIIRSTGEIKNADNYGCISKDDKTFRDVVYCNIREDNTLDEIPFYDLPMKSGDKFNFLGMGAGDGRQDGLFTYMNPIKAAGYNYEQFKVIAELIEQYLFDIPLGEEFENAIRLDAWEGVTASNNSNFYDKDKHFLHNVFAEYLKEKYHIKKINGQLHAYKDGVYVPGYEMIEKLIYGEIPTLTKTKRNEVLDCIRISSEESEPCPLNLIGFNNGIYNIMTDTLEPFSPQHNILNKIPWDYNPAAKSELVDSVLDKLSCNDTDIRYLLEEVAGACLYRSNTLGGGKAIMLIGDKENGKSTYIHMIETMLGKSNVSNLDFNELGDRFSTVMLYGKLANLGDDISDRYRDDVSLFKKISTGETIKAEEKGKAPINFTPYSTLIFSANNLPKMNDPTGAALRRLLIVPMKAKFSKSDTDYDPAIRYKLQQKEHIEYFIQCALDGLNDVLENKKFTVPDKVQKESEEYEKENNPLLAFIEDSGIDNIINEPTKEVYTRYQVFCVENGFKPLGNITFPKRINAELNTKIGYSHDKSGKTIKVYVSAQ